ncbi:hypothetical protein Pla110_29830 [Polystyrenella longa]|uniref:Uncharacterized protein n=1 Tax=Polystyrenella longa TaxID=2528007 RepID=A0A518CPX0_9PLAN|nr:hypothetical protein Pla110_29830 [Polystyrenella longa]
MKKLIICRHDHFSYKDYVLFCWITQEIINKCADGPHSDREMGVEAIANRVETGVKEGNLWRMRHRQCIIGLIVLR